MDEVITRIVDIERQCSAAVEQAQHDYATNIEMRKRFLEEKIIRERNQIIIEENSILTQAIEEAKKLTETASAAFQKDSERLFQDPVLNEALKKGIISILFAGRE